MPDDPANSSVHPAEQLRRADHLQVTQLRDVVDDRTEAHAREPDRKENKPPARFGERDRDRDRAEESGIENQMIRALPIRRDIGPDERAARDAAQAADADQQAGVGGPDVQYPDQEDDLDGGGHGAEEVGGPGAHRDLAKHPLTEHERQPSQQLLAQACRWLGVVVRRRRGSSP